MKRRLLLILLLLIMIFGLTAWWLLIRAADTAEAPASSTVVTGLPDTNEQDIPDSFNKSQYSLTEPTSLWVVVNKKNSLPNGYIPADLVVPDTSLRLARTHEQMQARAEAAQAITALIAAGNATGLHLVFGSGYRSEKLQAQFYNSYVSESGQAAADTFSARPGHSEHQTGLAIDLTRTDQKCHLEACFGQLPEGQWVAAHAHEYGFILRYQKSKEAITGYVHEPWHVRYVGKELAAQIFTNNTSLEEFFGLPAAANY